LNVRHGDVASSFWHSFYRSYRSNEHTILPGTKKRIANLD
jgi:hypothetical protein